MDNYVGKKVRYLLLNLPSAGVQTQEVQDETLDLTEESKAHSLQTAMVCQVPSS